MIAYTKTTVEGQPCAWIAGETAQHVAGELYNQGHLARALASVGGLHKPVVAWLIPEPTNEHDRHAVMIWILGGRCGYLPRREAYRWQPAIIQIEQESGTRV